jgi:hypothetical protein
MDGWVELEILGGGRAGRPRFHRIVLQERLPLSNRGTGQARGSLLLIAKARFPLIRAPAAHARPTDEIKQPVHP